MTRRRTRRPAPAPAVLPHVVVRPDDLGTVTITLDQHPVSDGPIPRVQLGEALGQIIEQLGAPVRVEVHEPDGAVYADILSPPARRPAQQPPPSLRDQHGRAPQLTCSGFLPGEPVHVAVTFVTVTADIDGHIDVQLDPKPARSDRGPVLAAGATSGTIHVQDPT